MVDSPSRSALSIYLPLWLGCGQHVVSVVRDVVGVVRAVASVIGVVADVGEEAIDADWICASSVVMAAKLSRLVVQVI